MKLRINPPPTDQCCEVCMKHVDDLKPFGKEGDPLVGNFDGAKLVKSFRTMAKKLTDKQKVDYIKEYGMESYEFYDQLSGTVEASWECRDCIILSDESYFKQQTMEKKNG